MSASQPHPQETMISEAPSETSTSDITVLSGPPLDTQGGDLYVYASPFTQDDSMKTLLTLWGSSPGALLAHVSDGLVWGRIEDGQVRLSHDVFPDVGAALVWSRLLDLKVFGVHQELRVFPRRGVLQAVILRESPLEETQQPPEKVPFAAYLERSYLLLGTERSIRGDHGEAQTKGFSRRADSAGAVHAPPCMAPLPDRLRVRHYYQQDPYGQYRLFEHRLLLTPAQKGA